MFVSSTFRDMQAEREELVKRIFPQLRKLCESRGVTWAEVDLRWGVPDEQRAEGRVLPICLAEIERCRPYFLGILGERYGWVPDDVPAELIEQQPWLAEHRERSVTELEILHGVLNNPAMADRAFFYFRSPAFIDTLPAGSREAYRELPTNEEVERLGVEEAARRAHERRQKLDALKDLIRAHALPIRTDYPDPQALGELVLQDLTEAIVAAYPEAEAPTPRARETARHEEFAARRTRVYLGDQAYFDRLDAHARGDSPPLVVVGESGAGKSALLANWGLRYRVDHPDEPLVFHFVGATPGSGDWAALLRRLMEELKDAAGIESPLPAEREAIKAAFPNWLQMTAAKTRAVLVIDALNQLEDRDRADELGWLPSAIPPGIRVVLSTVPGRALDALERRGWPTLGVRPLRAEERVQLVGDYLARWAKTLSPARVARVAGAPQTANPLYLRTLLDELRVFGVHERLDETIERYLSAATIDALYEAILERYEEDYERDRPGLVRDAMSLLWASRHGLSEVELLELLGTDGEPLPGAHWSPLYLAAEESLISLGGLLRFSHDYLRQAVQQRYLTSGEARLAAHVRLADYFDEQELGARKVDELPWQLARAGSWERLSVLLADLPFLSAALVDTPLEVKSYWAAIESRSDLRMVDAYRYVLDAPRQHGPDDVCKVALLLADTGHPAEALALLEYLLDHSRELGDRGVFAVALGNLAGLLYARGDLDVAMAFFQKQERLCRETGDRKVLASALGNQALVLHARGRLEEAMRLHEREEQICREIGDEAGVHRALGHQAVVLMAQGDADGALALHEREERICRELGDKEGLIRCLGNQALVREQRGELDSAMGLLDSVEEICRELGSRAALARTFGNQALVRRRRGDVHGALALWREQEQICRELDRPDGLARSLTNQALVLHELGQSDDALSLIEDAHQTAVQHGLTAVAQHTLTVLAFVRGPEPGS